MPNSNTSDGTEPIICDFNGYGNQRFIIREEAIYNGKMYYTISPLYAPDKTLKIDNNDENLTLELGNDNNTSYENFLSNKFIIEKTNNGFTISTGASNFIKYLRVQNNIMQTHSKIEQITVNTVSPNIYCTWEICKTDSLGLDLENKVYINGTSINYFNFTPPTLGEYIIETKKYGSDNIDTYLQLFDNNGTLLAYNDDIDGSNNRYSKIIYNFSKKDDISVRVRGYNANISGYIYLTLRPKYPLYFAAVYDFDQNNNDRPSTLKETKEFLPEHYIEVQANRGKNAILEFAPNNKRKINSEYFVFSGHGYSNASGVSFYNGKSSEGFMWNEIPTMNDTKIALWMACHSARNYFKDSSETEMTSMAYQTIFMGAEYSLGYIGVIYDTTQRDFPKNFFKALKDESIIDAITTATNETINDNWWWWNFYGKFNDDFANPIIYKKGDTLNLSCGDGNYGDDKNKMTNEENIKKNVITKDLFINNTDNENLNNTKSSNEFEMLFPYKFITFSSNKYIKLGFMCDENTKRVKYYNFSDNKEISSNEFEFLMGSPTKSTLNILSSSGDKTQL